MIHKKTGYYLRNPDSSNSLLHPPATFQLIYAHLIRGTFAYLHLPSLEIQPHNPRNDSSYKRNAAAHKTVDQVKTLQQACSKFRQCWKMTHQCSIISHTEGRSPVFLFQGSLHVLLCQKKEHSMRIKQDPSTILSTGKWMDAMHKHCCSQFNSQGRM